jgi:site-specific recombinase XerD
MPYGYIQYCVKKGYSNETIPTYEKVILLFFGFLNRRYFRKIELHEINPSDIKLFLKERANNGLQVNTLKRDLTILRQFFDYLWQTNQIPIDPIVKIRIKEKHKPRINEIDYSLLLSLKEEIFSDKRYSPMIKCIFLLGLKGFKLHDFHFSKSDVSELANGVEITTTNNGNIRRLVLTEIEEEIFMQHFIDTQFIPSDYVFYSKRHFTDEYGPINNETLTLYLRYIKRDYNIPFPLHLNSLRFAYIHHLHEVCHFEDEDIAQEFGLNNEAGKTLLELAIERYPVG